MPSDVVLLWDNANVRPWRIDVLVFSSNLGEDCDEQDCSEERRDESGDYSITGDRL